MLAKFTCGEEESAEECGKGAKFLPEATYNITHAYSRSIQDFVDIYPDLRSLSHCSFVKNRISDILLHHCTPLKLSTNLLWASVLSLSVIMLLLVSAWAARAFLCWETPLSVLYN